MLIDDIAINFPKHPMLLPNIQIDDSNGVVIYGSPNGPFKLNGSNVIKILNELLPLLQSKNTVESIVHQCLFKKSHVIQILEVLFLHGCLIEYIEYDNLKLIDKFYLHNISKNKNFVSLEEIYKKRESTTIHIFSFSQLIFKQIKHILEKYNFFVKFNDNINENDWCVYISDSQPNSEIDELSRKHKVLFFMVNSNGIQIGPIFSPKTVQKKYYTIGDSGKSEHMEIDIRYIANLLSMTIIHEVLTLSSGKLAMGYITINDNQMNYQKVLQSNTTEDHSIINKYEAEIKFPATEFINKSNHLTHFHPTNLKLGTAEYNSFLWKRVQNNNFEKGLLKLIHYTVGFKKGGNKKFTPTGGNINANLLFFIILDDTYLEGRGLYYFNNIDHHFYMINKIVEEDIKKVIKYQNKYKCFILFGNDVDLIAKKYGDFGFKLANLNCGIMLSQVVSITTYLKLKLEYLSNYEEAQLRKMLGIKTTNEIINFIVGVL
jgi:hypothetical protein